MVIKVFEKHVNNRIVDHLEKCGLFSDFQYGFMSSRSFANLLTVVSDRIARTFNRSGTTRAVALDICKDFERVCLTGLLHKRKSYGISVQIVSLTWLLCISVNLPYNDVWNTVVMFGLVLLVATWNC